MKRYMTLGAALFTLACGVLFPAPSRAFQGPGCMGKCADCHTLDKDEASKLLKTDKFKAAVKDIRQGPVKGLWEVELIQNDKQVIIYVDYAKKYLVEVYRFTPIEKIGEAPQARKVDLSKVPLEQAVVLGNPKAEKKVIVFDDPDCPFCKKLHEEIKRIMEKRKDIAFYIKMYPLSIHPEAYEKSRAIVCAKNGGKLLDDAFAGKKLSKASCDAKEVDNNIKLAEALGIRGTPAIILPDGRLVPGYVPADTLLDLIDNPQ